MPPCYNQMMINYWETSLKLCLQMSSFVKLCKQFGTRSDPTKRRVWSGSILFDWWWSSWKNFFKKGDFAKNQQTTKTCKTTQLAKLYKRFHYSLRAVSSKLLSRYLKRNYFCASKLCTSPLIWLVRIPHAFCIRWFWLSLPVVYSKLEKRRIVYVQLT